MDGMENLPGGAGKFLAFFDSEKDKCKDIDFLSGDYFDNPWYFTSDHIMDRIWNSGPNRDIPPYNIG